MIYFLISIILSIVAFFLTKRIWPAASKLFQAFIAAVVFFVWPVMLLVAAGYTAHRLYVTRNTH